MTLPVVIDVASRAPALATSRSNGIAKREE